MIKIFLSIVSGTMDAYTSIINNNLNIIMKFLASMAIILSIPNIIYGMYGMNIPLPLQIYLLLKALPMLFIFLILWLMSLMSVSN